MSGRKLCGPADPVQGVAISLNFSLASSIAAVLLAYGARRRTDILLGTVGFAAAVVSTHFIAMSGTSFFAEGETTLTGLTLSNATLAMIVLLVSFPLSGAALLSGVT